MEDIKKEPSKKIIVDDQKEMIKESIKENFIFEKVLNIDNDKKLIYLLGKHRKDDPALGIHAIVKIEKETFDEAMISQLNNKDDHPIISEDLYF